METWAIYQAIAHSRRRGGRGISAHYDVCPDCGEPIDDDAEFHKRADMINEALDGADDYMAMELLAMFMARWLSRWCAEDRALAREDMIETTDRETNWVLPGWTHEATMSYTSAGDPGVDAENLRPPTAVLRRPSRRARLLIAAADIGGATQAYWMTVLQILNDDPSTL